MALLSLIAGCSTEEEMTIHKIVYTQEMNGALYIEIHEDGTVLSSGMYFDDMKYKENAEYEKVYSFKVSANTFEYYAQELIANDFLTESFDVPAKTEFTQDFGRHFFRVYYNDTIKDFVIMDLNSLRIMSNLMGLNRYYESEIVKADLDREFIEKVIK